MAKKDLTQKESLPLISSSEIENKSITSPQCKINQNKNQIDNLPIYPKKEQTSSLSTLPSHLHTNLEKEQKEIECPKTDILNSKINICKKEEGKVFKNQATSSLRASSKTGKDNCKMEQRIYKNEDTFIKKELSKQNEEISTSVPQTNKNISETSFKIKSELSQSDILPKQKPSENSDLPTFSQSQASNSKKEQKQVQELNTKSRNLEATQKNSNVKLESATESIPTSTSLNKPLVQRNVPLIVSKDMDRNSYGNEKYQGNAHSSKFDINQGLLKSNETDSNVVQTTTNNLSKGMDIQNSFRSLKCEEKTETPLINKPETSTQKLNELRKVKECQSPDSTNGLISNKISFPDSTNESTSTTILKKEKDQVIPQKSDSTSLAKRGQFLTETKTESQKSTPGNIKLDSGKEKSTTSLINKDPENTSHKNISKNNEPSSSS